MLLLNQKFVAPILLTFAALVSVPASAQDTVTLSAEQQEAVDRAEERGNLLYRYDQAAWHGTDAFLLDFNQERDGASLLGYIVLEGEGDLLHTVFFGDFGDGLVEAARYSVDGADVVAGKYFGVDSRPQLSSLAIRLADSRQSAISALVDEGLGLCADASANTVVLPPNEQDEVEVYILTPPVSNDAYPLGGHYRFRIDADGEVADRRRFMNSCFDVSSAPARGDDGGIPIAAGISHVLDPQPTEIHFFATRYFGFPLRVITTDNDLVWQVADGDLIEVVRLGR